MKIALKSEQIVDSLEGDDLVIIAKLERSVLKTWNEGTKSNRKKGE